LLKKAKYDNLGFGSDKSLPEHGIVFYTMIGNCCYFSGTQRFIVTSTINAAEDIVYSIAKQEGKEVKDLRFFDLQTHQCYNFAPGTFQLDELIIEFDEEMDEEIEEGVEIIGGSEHGFDVTGWQTTKCPEKVINLFREQIGLSSAVN